MNHDTTTTTGAGANADFPKSGMTDALPPKALAVAAARRQLLVDALPHFSAGATQTEVCALLDVSAANLSRTLALAGDSPDPARGVGERSARTFDTTGAA